MFSWIGTIGSIYTLCQQILSAIKALGDKLVKLQEAFDRLLADSTAAATRVNTDLAALNGQVTTLQQQVSDLKTALANDELSPESQAAFEAVDNSINNIDVPAPVPVPDAPPVTG